MFPPPSGFEQHFGTNYTASEEEAAVIKQLLDVIDSDVAQLDTQIRHLIQKREALQLCSEEHQALVSPIRALPTGVLATIFLDCLPTHSNAIMSLWDMPLVLTQVCQRWRDLALSTPLLWARVHISIPITPSSSFHKISEDNWHKRMKNRAELLCLWFSRSQQCLLSVSIAEGAIGDNLSSGPRKDADAVIETILQHSTRWQTLDLRATPFIARTILALPPSRAPNLRDLRLVVTTSPQLALDAQSDLGPDSSSVTLSTPSLRNLRLDPGSYGTMRLPVLPIKWETLTSLKIEAKQYIGAAAIDARSALLILQSTRDLKDCTLCLQDTSGWGSLNPSSHGPSVASKKIVLANLCQFEIGPISASITQVIERLDLPSLKSLTFSPSWSPLADSALSASSLLLAMQRWGHSISSIEFDCANVASDTLQEFFKIADNIQELSLFSRSQRDMSPLQASSLNDHDRASARVDDSVLLALTPSLDHRSGGGALLPRLSRLHLGVSEPKHEFGVGPVTNFIAARRSPLAQAQGIAALEHLEIFFGFPRLFPRSHLEEAAEHLARGCGGELENFKLELGWKGCRVWGNLNPIDQLWDPALGADFLPGDQAVCRGLSCPYCSNRHTLGGRLWR
jgi:F-box-like